MGFRPGISLAPDAVAAVRTDWDQARENGSFFDLNRAGSTDRDRSRILRTIQGEVIAQHVQKRSVEGSASISWSEPLTFNVMVMAAYLPSVQRRRRLCERRPETNDRCNGLEGMRRLRRPDCRVKLAANPWQLQDRGGFVGGCNPWSDHLYRVGGIILRCKAPTSAGPGSRFVQPLARRTHGRRRIRAAAALFAKIVAPMGWARAASATLSTGCVAGFPRISDATPDRRRHFVTLTSAGRPDATG